MSANGGGWTVVHNGGGNSFGASRGNGSYAYRVRACNFAGCSPYSGIASVSVVLPPAATQIYVAKWLSTRKAPYQVQCSVGWRAVPGATEYQLEPSGAGRRLYTGLKTYVQSNGGTCCASLYIVRPATPVVVRHGPQTSRHPRRTELGLSHEWTLFAVDSGGTRGGGAGGLYGASDRPGSGRVPPH